MLLRCTRVLGLTRLSNFSNPFISLRSKAWPSARFWYRNFETDKVSLEHKIKMAFTCNICETRQIKVMSRTAYTQGVVLVRCIGCEKLHLIADNIGYFGSGKGTIEDILKEKGENLSRLSDDEWEIDPISMSAVNKAQKK